MRKCYYWIVKYNQKNGTLEIVCSDGSHRYYSSNYLKDLFNKKKQKDKTAKFHLDFEVLSRSANFYFQLDKHHLANGNRILYTYKDAWPIEVKITNPSETKTYSKINTIINNNQLISTTSCNKTLKIYGDANIKWMDYLSDWNNKKKEWEKKKIPRILGFTYRSKVAPEKPEESFNYLEQDGKVISDCISPDKKKLHPDERRLHIDYYTLGNHVVNNTQIDISNTQDDRFMRVKSIAIPNENGDLQNIYYFIYYPGKLDQKNGYTEVFDSDGNKTIYRYSNQLRLEAIERYILNNNEFGKVNSEQFVWGKNNEATFLESKTIFDSGDNAIFSKRFIYDIKGNLSKEISYGNFSGICQVPLIIENGLVKDNGIEKFSIERTFSNDEKNLLIQQKDDNGLIISFAYHANTDKIASKFLSYKQLDQIKQRTFFEYDADNILIKEIQDDGISLNKNDLTSVTRRTIKIINPRKTEPYGLIDSIEEKFLDINTGEEKLIKKEKYEYDKNRRIRSKEIFGSDNRSKYFLKYQYDEKGNIISETDPLGREAIYEYDASDNKRYEKDFCKKEKSFEYDLCNRLIKTIIKDGSKTFTEEYGYDLKNNKIMEKDIYENIKKHEYDAFNNLIKEIYPKVQNTFGEIAIPIKSYTYDDLSRQIQRTDPNFNTITTSYNAYHKPVKIKYPDNTAEENIYNLDGTLKMHINQEGLITRYEYDYLKRVIVKQIYSSANELLREELFDYSAFDLLSKKDADGNTTIYSYDGFGRKIKEEIYSKDQILLFIEELFYDELGFIAKKIKGKSLVTIYERDFLGRVLEKRKENFNTKILYKIRYKYDKAGNKKFITSYIAKKESIEKRKYDVFDRLIKTTDAVGNETNIKYSEFQNELNQKVKQVIHENALKQKVITTYDALHREKTIECQSPRDLPLSLEEKFYDLNNNLTRQKSTIYYPDRSHKDLFIYWHYDNMNRLDIEKEAYNSEDEKTTIYSYTPTSKLRSTLKPDGVILENLYDPLGNTIRVFSSKKDIDYRFTYNNLNQLIKIEDKINNKVSIRQYDALNNLLTETLSNGLTLKSEYDLLGNRTKLIFPDNSFVQYFYDGLYLKKIIKNDLNATPLYEHNFLEYDLSGNLLKEKLISNAGFVNYKLDLLEQIISLQTDYHTQNTSFDEIGRISKIEYQGFLNDTSEYEYDDLNQIILEKGLFSNNYEFDSPYNRLKKNQDSYQINDLNQILATSEKEFVYDKNGNLIVKKTKHGEMKFIYDSLDRLIKLEKPNNCILEFTYDALNRRTSKKTYKYSCLKGYYQEDFRYFLYDDQNEIGSFDEHFIQKELRILANTKTAEIGSAISFEIDQNIFAPIYDISGNVISLIDNDTLSEHYRYSAFGEKKIYSSNGSEISNSVLNNPWQFSSKRFDQESNLTYFGRRYYEPKLGRWITPDPKGFVDSLNLYAFVLNDPLINSDLYGLYANPFMFPAASKMGNDFSAAVIHKTVDFGADVIMPFTHVGFGLSAPFLFSYHAITQKGSLTNDFKNHLQNTNLIKKDIQNFMQKVMPANQNSKYYKASSMLTAGAWDGVALGSSAAAGYQFANKAAYFTSNALASLKNLRSRLGNASSLEMASSNRAYSGLDVKQMLKEVNNTILKNRNMFDQKFFIQLQRQFDKHGMKSVIKSYKSLKQLQIEHLEKLKNIKFTSSVEREINTFNKQIDTLEFFAKKNNIKLP